MTRTALKCVRFTMGHGRLWPKLLQTADSRQQAAAERTLFLVEVNELTRPQMRRHHMEAEILAWFIYRRAAPIVCLALLLCALLTFWW
jgi:hypothetical protein